MKKLFIFCLFSFLIFIFLVSANVHAQEETVTPTEAESVTTAPGNQRTKTPRQKLNERRKDAMQKDNRGALRRIAGKGTRVHLVDAEVTAVSDTTLTVKKDDKTYTVNTDAKTKFRRHFWGRSELTEFSVGNIVNIWGTWADETQTTINAKMIRNLSIMKRHGVFFGTIKTVGDNSFVITSVHRGDQAVTLATTTKLINRREQAITFGDLQVGHRIRVKGLWDKSQNTVTEVRQVKDFSLPPQTEKTTTTTPTATETPVE